MMMQHIRNLGRMGRTTTGGMSFIRSGEEIRHSGSGKTSKKGKFICLIGVSQAMTRSINTVNQ